MPVCERIGSTRFTADFTALSDIFSREVFNTRPIFSAQKSKIVAGLLGLFLGTLGVHNFYLGYTGKAVAQLLLTLIGWIILIGPIISGIWALIEAVLILCSSYGSNWHRDGHGQELQD